MTISRRTLSLPGLALAAALVAPSLLALSLLREPGARGGDGSGAMRGEMDRGEGKP